MNERERVRRVADERLRELGLPGLDEGELDDVMGVLHERTPRQAADWIVQLREEAELPNLG